MITTSLNNLLEESVFHNPEIKKRQDGLKSLPCMILSEMALREA